MAQKGHEPDLEFDRIDADAVCEACGTVNPEDTLFCKSCGNNLRDQRVHRIAEGKGIEELEGSETRPVQFLSKALAVLGILIVIWTAINVSNGNIEEWLLSTQSKLGNEAGPQRLWHGADGAVCESLLREITDHPVTKDDIARAQTATASTTGFDGRYYLKSAANASDPIIGEAAVRQESGQIYFVAKLFSGAEIRGELDTSRPNPATKIAAVKIGGRVVQAYGLAQRAQDGSFICYGQRESGAETSGANNELPTVTAFAYRIPKAGD